MTSLSETPSITQINLSELIDNILKPSFYAASRFSIINGLDSNAIEGYTTKKLSEIADFVTKERKSFMVSDNIKHISILHINPDCTINFNSVKSFVPISKGHKCETGDILFSRINPRIPRMAVVPNAEYDLVCSNEFEILRAKEGINPYVLCFLLKTQKVQVQIETMTSGTSSSHSRIKREQLENVLITIPSSPNEMKKIEKLGQSLKNAINMIYEAELSLNSCMNSLEEV